MTRYAHAIAVDTNGAHKRVSSILVDIGGKRVAARHPTDRDKGWEREVYTCPLSGLGLPDVDDDDYREARDRLPVGASAEEVAYTAAALATERECQKLTVDFLCGCCDGVPPDGGACLCVLAEPGVR